jgi:hypothetical protein
MSLSRGDVWLYKSAHVLSLQYCPCYPFFSSTAVERVEVRRRLREFPAQWIRCALLFP